MPHEGLYRLSGFLLNALWVLVWGPRVSLTFLTGVDFIHIIFGHIYICATTKKGSSGWSGASSFCLYFVIRAQCSTSQTLIITQGSTWCNFD